MHKNENRPGYKKTKVGWIPEGWECKQLAKTGLQVIDGDRGNNYPSQSDFFPIEHCLFLNAGNVTSDGFRFTEKQFISRERDALLRKGKLKRGDLVVTTRGTIGNFAHYTEDVPYEHVRINSGMAIIRNASDKISPSFIWKYFHSSIFDKELRRVTFGSAIPQLTIGLIQKFPIPVSPSLPEQEAIAEVLDCWDKGIRTLEKKIEKKRLIKKGLMQKLLSGQTRLPGFSKGWKTIRLGDLGEFKTSSVDKKNEPDQEEAYLVNYMDVYRHRFITKEINFQKITATPTEIEKSQIQKGDILFTPSSETPDDIGHSAVVTEDLPKVLQSYHVVRLRIKNDDDLDFNFRGYVFNNADILNTFAHLSTGATRYTLSLGDFKNTQAYIPSDPKEQRAIAEVLAAADGEIEALEKKLALWKDQKKFLLNNLVTGTMRLPQFS